MHTQTFTYIPIKVGEPMTVRIDQDDEFHHVTIGDTYLGTMIEDDSDLGWKTEDQPLLDELPDLAMALREEKAIYNLPFALKELFPNDVIDWEWKEDDSLNLLAHPETDLEEFASVIRGQINEIVLFDKAVIIHLIQDGNKNGEEIHVNC
jgi:hypothetical protein